MKKKILSSLIIGAFVFGVGAANVQPVDAASFDKAKEAKEKFDKARDMFGDKNSGDTNRPAPPTDENGNPMPPPDKNSGDTNRPEPPKDENGNPMPPPDKNSDGTNRPEPPDKNSDGTNRPEPPDKNSDGMNRPEPPDKNSFDKAADMKDKYDKAKELFNK